MGIISHSAQAANCLPLRDYLSAVQDERVPAAISEELANRSTINNNCRFVSLDDFQR